MLSPHNSGTTNVVAEWVMLSTPYPSNVSGGSLDDNEREMLLFHEDCETGEEFRSTNIMDYAYTEANRFTPQQAARIRYVLEHSPYIPGPKVRLPEQMPTTKAAF